MTLYLTDEHPGRRDRPRQALRIHPWRQTLSAGATTHSQSGVTDIKHVYGVLARMEKIGMPLLVHGESAQIDVDVFDRETHFIESVLAPLLERFSALRVVFEHITTAGAVEFVRAARGARGGHHYPAAPAAQSQCAFFRRDTPALLLPADSEARGGTGKLCSAAATSGNPRYFLGTDSAPHERSTKETACGCAGMFTAHAAIELYAEAFESAGKLERLEGFASHFGADFYGLARHSDTITLLKETWTAPQQYAFGSGTLLPYRAGEPIGWRLARNLSMSQLPPITFATRFRGFLPVVIDVETGGFNSHTDALLEIAAVFIEMRSDGTLARGETHRYHVIPFPGANMEPASMAVTGIDPASPTAPGDLRRRCAAAHLQRSQNGDSNGRLHPCRAGRPQRILRPEFLECRGEPRAGEAQSLSSIFKFRYRHAGRHRLRTDRADARHPGRRARVGQLFGALGGL